MRTQGYSCTNTRTPVFAQHCTALTIRLPMAKHYNFPWLIVSTTITSKTQHHFPLETGPSRPSIVSPLRRTEATQYPGQCRKYDPVLLGEAKHTVYLEHYSLHYNWASSDYLHWEGITTQSNNAATAKDGNGKPRSKDERATTLQNTHHPPKRAQKRAKIRLSEDGKNSPRQTSFAKIYCPPMCTKGRTYYKTNM